MVGFVVVGFGWGGGGDVLWLVELGLKLDGAGEVEAGTGD